ncbi:MAG: hypothetical protein AUK16_01030 [Parcubacteria group bacterium CG2_30_44_11]|nr:MAG: hypothetical protein AUK16_01030 [Parcubacteria group bacterium CG2_30_44_11]
MTQIQNNEQKESLIKVLAIVGFLAAIVLLVFIAVKVVTFIPGAFNSLASIADSVYNYDKTDTLKVTTPTSVVKTDEGFTISWKDMNKPGTYSFMVDCVSGINADVRTADGEIIAVVCGEPFKLAKDQTSLEIVMKTRIDRFTDIPYSITFTPSDPRQESVSASARVTIINASIPTGTTVTETPAEPAKEVATETTVVTPVETKPVIAKPQAPVYVETPIYAIPASNPNGTIDLQVVFIGVGELNGSSFTLLPELQTGKAGAIRFSVKNIGTKTADDWSFNAKLPSDLSFESTEQNALKPNEEAIITLNFTGISRTGVESFGVTVDATADVNSKNNSFTWAVNVVN